MGKVGRIAVLAAAATLAIVPACAPVADRNAWRGPENCNKESLATLYPGIFTFGTDQPVYPPWYMGDDPANGEGFESAVAYAVAGKLGYTGEDVRWVRVPFAMAITAGPKTFDADLSQFSITEQRKAAVVLRPYFDVTQAVVTVKSSPAARARKGRIAAAQARCAGRYDQSNRGDLGGRQHTGRALHHQRRRQARR